MAETASKSPKRQPEEIETIPAKLPDRMLLGGKSMRTSLIFSGAFRFACIAVTLFCAGFDSEVITTACPIAATDSISQSRLTTGLDQFGGTLILSALLGVLVIVGIERALTIFRATTETRAYERRALTALFYDRVDEAGTVATLFPRSPVALVVTASLHGTDREGTAGSRDLNPSKPAFQRALIAQTISLKKRLWMLSAIGWSSPIIGLVAALGPSVSHAADPPLALLFGLALAVPAIWLHRGLSSEVDGLLLETERMSLSIIEQITVQARGQFDNDVAFRHHSAP